MDAPFIETGCIVEFEGKKFESGGAYILGEHAAGYLEKNDSDQWSLADWHGNHIGYARVVSSWKVDSWIGNRMYQVEVKINGKWYTGRGFGNGMLWRGKLKKNQN